MLTAVWVAVVAAAVAFVVAVGVAVYVMLKAARLMSQTSATVFGLRERGDLLIDRANAAVDQANAAADRAGEQIARTQTVTASMEDVTAAMAELGGQFAAIAPPAPTEAEIASGPLTWAAALVYGLRWAVGARRPGADLQRQAAGWPVPAARGPAKRGSVARGQAGRGPGWSASPGRANAPRGWAGRTGLPGREAGRKAAALTSRSNGAPR